MASDVYGPFEGPEKLLEVWFAPSPASIPGAHDSKDGKFGLRKVPRKVWEDMLDIVKCKVLSMVQGIETDAYLLRSVRLRSSFLPPERHPTGWRGTRSRPASKTKSMADRNLTLFRRLKLMLVTRSLSNAVCFAANPPSSSSPTASFSKHAERHSTSMACLAS